MDIADMIRTLEKEISRHRNTIDRLKNGARIYIWGTKMVGTATAEYLQKAGYNNITFIDSDYRVQGQCHSGINIISPAEVNDPDGIFIVGSAYYQDEILDEMRLRSIKQILSYFSIDILLRKEDYLRLFDLLADDESRNNLYKHMMFRLTADKAYLTDIISDSPQYFEKDIISLSETDCFIDGGGYNGDTLKEFLRECRGIFSKYYLFEPNTDLITIAKNATVDSRVIFCNMGLYSQKKTMSFFATMEMNGHIVDGGNESITINVVPLDEAIREKITFCKLDVEGAELDALKGAQRHLLQDRPKLAVSAYHRPEDFLEIINFLHSKVPDYSFFLRTYGSPATDEIILYAIDKKGQ
jgi:FkbM family methyltransferase